MVGHCNDIKFICKVISDGPHFRYLKGRLYTLPTKNKTKSLIFTTKSDWNGGCRSRDRMVVGYTTTYVISAYNHCCCEFESRSRRGVKHYLINFVSDFKHHQTIKQIDWNGDKCFHLYTCRVLVFNATFNNIRLVYLYIYFIIII